MGRAVGSISAVGIILLGILATGITAQGAEGEVAEGAAGETSITTGDFVMPSSGPFA